MHIRIIPNEIIKATGGRFAGGIGLTMIESVCVDSRTAAPGCLFVPLQGARTDGHRFIETAFDRGAVAALIRSSSGLVPGLKKRYPRKILIEVDDTLTALGDLARFWRHKLRPAVVAVIGSRARETRDSACRIVGQHGRVLVNPPGGDSLHQLPLCLMGLSARHTAALLVLEGEVRRLLDICDPAVILITGGGRRACRELEQILAGLSGEHTVILDADDPRTAGLARATAARVLTFGLKKGDIRALRVRRAQRGRHTFDLQMLQQNAGFVPVSFKGSTLSCALGAAAIGHLLGIDLEDIRQGLEG